MSMILQKLCLFPIDHLCIILVILMDRAVACGLMTSISMHLAYVKHIGFSRTLDMQATIRLLQQFQCNTLLVCC